MPFGRFLCAALLGIVSAGDSAFAQATKDQARLVFTIAGGAVIGSKLWSVDRQPVRFMDPPDTLGLDRRIRSTLAFSFGGAYFPGENVGFTVEAFLVGLGFDDDCRHVFSSGSPDVAAVCQSIQGKEKAATSVMLSGGTMFRVNSRKLVSPYGRLNLGLVLSQQSSLRTTGLTTVPSDLVVYADDRSSRVDPAITLGAGFTASVTKGYNLWWEIRDNIVGVQRVTGPIPIAGSVPPHERVYKHLFSVLIGFDVVLERRKGRRY
jgi:hypothetical protein